jgi:hypothetical protein
MAEGIGCGVHRFAVREAGEDPDSMLRAMTCGMIEENISITFG